MGHIVEHEVTAKYDRIIASLRSECFSEVLWLFAVLTPLSYSENHTKIHSNACYTLATQATNRGKFTTEKENFMLCISFVIKIKSTKHNVVS